MSGIAGVLRLDDGPFDMRWPSRMADRLAHRGPDGRVVWNGDRVGLAHVMLCTTPESRYERQPLCDEPFVLVADARIDNRDGLIAELRLANAAESPATDAAIVLAAYRRWGAACPERLIGDFAFAIWDAVRREMFCARDGMGVRALYYYHDDRLFAFATEIKALFEVDVIPRQLNEDRIADYLIRDFDDLSGTFFRGVRRLRAGHAMTVGPRELAERRYWSLDAVDVPALRSDRECEEAFRAVFTEAVRCRLRSAFPIGTTLSGGLDSSSITCVARQCLRGSASGPLHAFSAVFPSLPEHELRIVDERAYVAKVVEGGGLIGHEVRADRLDPLSELERILWHQDDPLIPFNLYVHLGIYDAARTQGVRVLLDGLDGDTTVSHGFELLAELARRLRLGALYREARALSRQFDSRSMPVAKLIRTHGIVPLLPNWAQPVPAALASSRRSARSIIADEFSQRMRLDARLRARRGAGGERFRSARRAHARGIESPLLPYLLELADKATAAYGLEARYPFFDRRLIELCVALPAAQKLRAGWTRSILRRAMQGVLPPQIQWRRGKADLSPNFHRNLLDLGAPAVERALYGDGPSLQRYLDPVALRELHARYRQHPTNADGATLFMAVTLAAWLRSAAVQHKSPAAGVPGGLGDERGRPGTRAAGEAL